MPRSSGPIEQVIMKVAAGQHGVVARFQLLSAGVGSDLVEHRLATGWLRRLHRGVYLVGPLAVPKAREMAAVLACGGHAVLSGRNAAWSWQLRARPGDGERVDVLVFRGRASSRRGINVRNVHSLSGDERTVHDGIPITTPARTLYDLAGVAGERELERAVAEAFARRLVGRSELPSLLDRHKGRPGATRLRALIDRGSGHVLTRSEAEERFLALTRKARVRAPDANATVAAMRWTSSGVRSAWSWKWTATPTTRRGDASRATAAATPTCSPPTCASCA